MRSTRTAPRASSTLVAVSCGELMTVTLAARARGADLFVDRQTAGDDDGVDARGDRHFLNVRAVADEEDDVAISIFLQARTEGILRHGADHEELFSRFRRERSGDERAGKGGDDIGERSRDAARRPASSRGGKR